MSEIQALELQVRDNAQEAAGSLNALATSLNRVRSAIGGGINLSGVSEQISSLTASIHNAVSGGAVEGLHRLANALRTLNQFQGFQAPDRDGVNTNIDAQEINDATGAMRQEMDAADALTSSMQTLGEVAENARGQMELPPVLESLQENPIDTAGIVDTTAMLGETRDAAEAATTGMQTLDYTTEQLTDDLVGIEGAANTAMEGLGNVQQEAEAANSGMNGTRAAVGTAISSYNMLGGAMQGLRDIISSTMPTIQALGHGALNIATSAVNALKAGVSRAISAFREFKNKISLSNTALGRLFKSIKRIATVRMIRAALRAVTQGVKEGIDNLYQYSSVMGGQFARAMDQGSSTALQFKNSIGAMLGPVIQAAIPLLIRLANAAITAMNALNQVFAVLTGATTWTKATQVMNKYNKSTKAAGGATKELLADWDELNIIVSESGGGGAGGNNTDFSSMFKTEPLPKNKFTDFAQQIKDLIKAGDWEAVGKLLAEKVNGVIGKLDTKKWAKKFNQWVRNALKLAVSFLKNTDFEALGNKIGIFLAELFGKGNKINWQLIGEFFRLRVLSIIRTAKGVIKTPGLFEGIGSSLATAVKSMFTLSQNDIDDISVTFSGGINGIVTAANTFITETPFAEIGTKVGKILMETVAKINWNAIGKGLRLGLMSAFEFLYGVVSTPGFFDKIGTSIASTINGFFAFTPAQLKKITETLNTSLTGALSGITTFLTTIDWEKIGTDVGTFLAGINWSGIFVGVWNVIVAALKASVSLVTGFAKGIGSTVLEQILANVDEIRATLTDIGTAGMAIGAILAFTGINIPLGIALMALGAVGMATAKDPTWGSLTGNIETDAVAIENIVGKAFLALGAILAFTGINIPLGVGLLAAGAVALIDSADGTAGDIMSDIREKWSEILAYATIISGFALGLGILLAFTGHPIGLYLMAAGAAELGITAANGGDVFGTIKEKWEDIRGWVIGISTAFLVLGLILALTGAATIVGLGMIAMGVAGLAFEESTEGSLLSKITEKWNEISEYLSVASLGLFALGLILALTGAGLGVGLAMMGAGITGIILTKGKALTGLIDEVKKLWEELSTWANTTWENLTKWFDEKWQAFLQIIKPFVDPIIDIINAVIDAVNWLFGTQIEHLARIGEEKTESIFAGIAQGAENGQQALQNQLNSLNTTDPEYGIDGLLSSEITNLKTLAEQYGIDFDEIKRYMAEHTQGLDPDSDEFYGVYEALLADLEKYGSDWKAEVDKLDLDVPEPNTDPLKKGMEGAAQGVENSVAAIKRTLASLDGVGFTYTGTDGGLGGRFSTVGMMASGGMVTAGEMFVARESGPEMVGRIGSNTAVANNDQIVAGITSGVAAGQAEQNSLLRRQNELLSQLLNKRMVAEVKPSSGIGRVNQQSNLMWNRVTG